MFSGMVIDELMETVRRVEHGTGELPPLADEAELFAVPLEQYAENMLAGVA